MTTAKEILKLIENVDVNDSDALDEIDARVWCYLGGGHYGSIEPVKFVSFGDKHFDGDDDDIITKNVLTFSFKGKYEHEKEYRDCILSLTLSTRYTRSRDELKSIRPEGFDMCLEQDKVNILKGFTGSGWECSLYNDITSVTSGLEDDNGDTYSLPTEELAELHAIIQAIEWERNQ